MWISLLKCHVDKRAICHFKKLSKLLRLLVFKKKLTASAWSKILKFYKGTENVTHRHHSLEDLLSSCFKAESTLFLLHFFTQWMAGVLAYRNYFLGIQEVAVDSQSQQQP